MSEAYDKFMERLQTSGKFAISPGALLWLLFTGNGGNNLNLGLTFKVLAVASCPVLLPAHLITIPLGAMGAIGSLLAFLVETVIACTQHSKDSSLENANEKFPILDNSEDVEVNEVNLNKASYAFNLLQKQDMRPIQEEQARVEDVPAFVKP